MESERKISVWITLTCYLIWSIYLISYYYLKILLIVLYLQYLKNAVTISYRCALGEGRVKSFYCVHDVFHEKEEDPIPKPMFPSCRNNLFDLHDKSIERGTTACSSSGVNSSYFELTFWSSFSRSWFNLFGINLIAFRHKIKINAEFFLFNLTYDEWRHHRRRSVIFLLLEVVEDKNLRQNVESQEFGLETFLVKGNNVENIPD